MEKPKKKLILIDSNALLHRAYHALPPLSKKDGTLTNAVYGYALTIFSVLDKFKPEYIVATFDLAGPTFRHEQYKEYKATRKKAPDEFYEQIPMAKEFLRAFNIPIFEKQGFEADDMIGTIAKSPKINGNIEIIIVTGDLDTLQLVDDRTKVFTLRRGITDTVTYDAAMVEQRYGLKPDQMIEYKSLRGDQSDNIPGVKGIGEKTATELLLEYKNINNLYKNIDKISSESTRKKLAEGKESAFMSRQLATIDTQVPIDFDLDCCLAHDYDRAKLLDFLKEMEFHSLVKKLESKKETLEKTKHSSKNTKDSTEKIAKKSDIEKIVDIKIDMVSSEKQANKIAAVIQKEKKLAFSFSCSDDKFYQSEIFGMGIGYGQENQVVFVPKEYLKPFRNIFEDENILKIGYNTKFEYEILSKFFSKIEFKNYEDVQISAYLLMSGTANELEKLIFGEFGQELEYRVVKKGQASLLDNTEDIRQKSAAERAFWINRLAILYKEKIKQISQEQEKRKNTDKFTLKWVYEKVEMPLVEILAQMEMAGVKINKEKLNEGSRQAQEEITQLEKEIYKLAGSEFNINSPVQLAKVLYEDLEIPTLEIKRGKTGYSTDADQLRKIHDYHPIIAHIENYRELFKVKTTYTDTLPLLVEDDDRIHANFNQAVTATGRLSSSEPNLQNIPKKGKLANLIRQAFIADKGYTLVSADYSQIDLRAAAHLSNDERLIEAFQTGQDIHRTTAAWVNGIKPEQVTDKQRSEAKSLNFGVLYGMGTYGFMRDSGVDRKRAEFFIDEYMKKFSNLKKFLDETKKFAQEHGYVETEIGRRRYIPNMKAGNYQIRNAAERMAINLPVQGLSADIMKLAMLDVQQKVLSRFKDQAKLILQVHDELIFEVKDAVADEFMQKVKTVMEDAYEMRVPLVVEVDKGKNWAEI